MHTKHRQKVLTLAVASLLAGTVTFPVPAQTQQSNVDCSKNACTDNGRLLFKVRTRGEEQPVTSGTTDKSSSEALQPDRRVSVAIDPPGVATAIGKWSIDLPSGGVIWATEDPTLGQPNMTVSGTPFVPFENGAISKPVRFYGYTNYAPFIESAQVLIFRATDGDLVNPLASVDLKVAPVMEAEWDGALPANAELRQGDELIYIVRATGADGNVDETYPQRMQLLTAAEAERGATQIRNALETTSGIALNTAADAERMQYTQATFGRSSLRQQNITIRGSRIRIQGRNLPEGTTLNINGNNIPVDMERKAVAEFLEPIGHHTYDVDVSGRDGKLTQQLDVDVTGKYMFAVAIADLTASSNSVSGSIQPIASDDRYSKDFILEGRLGFYLKGKVNGKYLITAQADTREREVKQLFNGFWKADPADIFRRLDPDLYYPVYGDDSTAYRDVDTMGRLYVRVDWDQNQALWGNYNTGMTGTEYAQYNRSLYGGALSWRSRASNKWGEPGSEFRIFGSDAQTAMGHNEFLGTGGSLYYLKNTDVLPGSDKVTLEIRDGVTGRTVNRVELVRGVDYDMDEMQGRLILTRPLLTITRENVIGITRDAPLDGYAQLLMVDYEYIPKSFDPDNRVVGFRGKHWLGNHLAVGASYVDENRDGDDYNLKGVDVTLQAGRGTYIKAERSRTQSTVADIYRSDNGGLSFAPLGVQLPGRSGEATAIEARANFQELGWTKNEWAIGAWDRKVDDGFSVARYDAGAQIHEYGAEFMGRFNPALSLYGRYSRAERGSNALEQGQLTGEWRMSDASTWTAELRRVDEQRYGISGVGTLGALRYKRRFNDRFELWGTGQKTLDNDHGRYADNDAISVGGKYLFGNLSTITGEVTSGDRGDAAILNAEYRLAPDHTIYGGYAYSTDTTEYDPLFANRVKPGWTLGQRWRLTNTVNMFNESQYLKAPGEAGLAHTFGMDFYPSMGWNYGFTLQKATLDKVLGEVDRRAISLTGGHTSNRTQWQSKVEWREDRGIEQRQQWVTTNNLTHKLSESLRLAGRFNYSKTTDDINPSAGAKFVEGNFGFAYRPWNSTKYALFGKYTYLYDVSALQQQGPNVAWYDQKSQVLSLEGVYHPSDNWEYAGKLAARRGEVRYGRLAGQWAKSDATFAAIQTRYGIGNSDWKALAEYRMLNVTDGGTRSGFLVGIDRDITRNFRVGVGYNFTDFGDDLTDYDYRHQGWFINVVGRY